MLTNNLLTCTNIVYKAHSEKLHLQQKKLTLLNKAMPRTQGHGAFI